MELQKELLSFHGRGWRRRSILCEQVLRMHC